MMAAHQQIRIERPWRGRLAAKAWLAWRLWLGCWLACPAQAYAGGTAFYYGEELPGELLEVHDHVVVDADALARAGLAPAQLEGRNAQLVAYVSLGELAHSVRPPGFHDDWVIGQNHAWHSHVMDLTHQGWRTYLLDRMSALWQRGYRGFFFDTLDSYHLAELPPGRVHAQRAALVSLITEAHRRHPQATLIMNRGFELLPEVAPLVSRVAAESLFDRWDAAAQAYVPVPPAERNWLLQQLRQVREHYQLPITVIDYRPPAERALARVTASQIAALGFEPWVTNADLTTLGVGQPEVVPRRILIFFDGAREHASQSMALRWLVPILERQGYVPVLRDVRAALPREPLPGRYVGLATWFLGPLDGDGERFSGWLERQLDEGMRVAIFGELGLAPEPTLLERLGLALATRPPGRVPSLPPVVQASSLIGLEAPPRPHRWLGPGLIAADPELEVHLRIADEAGPLRDPVVIGRWGGMALAPHLLQQGYGGEHAWVVDPVAFVRHALSLEPIPIPDVTTENGHRLLMLHVAPDGAERPAELKGMPSTRQVVRALLTEHRWPHSTTDAALARGLGHVALRALELAGPGSDMTRASPELTRLRPYARPAGLTGLAGAAALEPMLPIASDDGYRELSGSSFGFRRVLETLELTDASERLAPIAIAYHAYVAATPAGLRALEDIYAWLETQDTWPLYTWEYARKVRNFYELVLARDLNSREFELYGLDALRTVRLPQALGWPDIDRSSQVVAVRELPQGRYVSFAGSSTARLALARSAPEKPVIIGTNGTIVHAAAAAAASDADRESLLRLRIRGRVPVSVVIGNLPAAECALYSRGARVRGQPVAERGIAGAMRFSTRVNDTGDATVRCQVGAAR